MQDDALRKEILIAFEYSYLHDSWVNPLEEALEGVTAEQAHWRPGPEAMGIWDMVLHLAVWHENIVERVATNDKSAHPAEGAWPEKPATPDPAQWEAAKVRLWDSLAKVREMLETTPMEVLANNAYGLGDIFCRFTHNAYHIGQITKMREMPGFPD